MKPGQPTPFGQWLRLTQDGAEREAGCVFSRNPDSVHADLANQMAWAVTDHATPVGSGTVARTKRIPVEQRAEAAVIAWMRHQTTGYDGSSERTGETGPGTRPARPDRMA
jgi:hypothetical protein